MSDESKIAEAVLSMLGISTLAAASRTMLSEDRRSFAAFARGLVMALFSGIIAGLIVYDYNFSPAIQGAITGVCAFVSDDLLLMILGISGTLRKRPKEFLEVLLTLMGGKK